MPEISVLLPALDAAATIAEAVTSTLRALPADAELVVLDDGSTDDTADCATRAADEVGRAQDLRILRNPQPGGVARALNRMLAETDSCLVGRMDADDVSLRGRFTACRRAIAAGDDFVFTQVVKTSGRRVRPNPPLTLTPSGFADELLLTNPVAHSSMLATRAAIDTLGGYREVPAEDYDLWLRAATADMRLRRLARWGLVYRTHPNQLTATQGWFGKSWRNPDQAGAYADFTEHRLGKRLLRPVAIAALPEAERLAAMGDFREVVGAHLARVGGLHGILLRRRLRRRMEWITSAAGDTRAAESRRRDQR
ncbi:glycosyltransferase [Schaalia sp. 19OD2882]|uniref:glycosyltransferase family 2 protein n=1 Tax=Schaalia sp. 19OD2882 TaxID=2794089 RepID=UPI001C1EDDBD|nr:glycosyltransferase [Schaalia sp. 19OD2882]QWW19176.1 glycosyltransferase [Schaalia sp. 19OD2882]